MNQEIMKFSNTLVYKNKMSCSNDQVKSGRLDLYPMNNDEWIEQVIDPLKPVVFIDYINFIPSQKEDCRMTSRLVQRLISNRISPKDIGVISPLNEDVDEIKEKIRVFLKNNNLIYSIE